MVYGILTTVPGYKGNQLHFQGTMDTNYSFRAYGIPTAVPGCMVYQLQFQGTRDTNYSSRVQGIPTTVPLTVYGYHVLQ